MASSDLNRIRVGRNLASSLDKSKRRIWFAVISAHRSETGSGVAYSDNLWRYRGTSESGSGRRSIDDALAKSKRVEQE
ncbi:MAG: hypothetical protein ACLQEQ_02000 [Nitrososphaerales archaeon]